MNKCYCQENSYECEQCAAYCDGVTSAAIFDRGQYQYFVHSIDHLEAVEEDKWVQESVKKSDKKQ